MVLWMQTGRNTGFQNKKKAGRVATHLPAFFIIYWKLTGKWN